MTFRACTTAILSATILVGCASAGPQAAESDDETRTIVRVGSERVEMYTQAAEGERSLGVPPATVFEVLPEAFELMEIPVAAQNPQTFEIGNDGYRARRVEGKLLSTYLDCGSSLSSGIVANSYDITLQVIVRLRQDDDGGTVMTTRVDAIGEPRATSGNQVHCQSKGTLEERMADLTARLLVGIPGL